MGEVTTTLDDELLTSESARWPSWINFNYREAHKNQNDICGKSIRVSFEDQITAREIWCYDRGVFCMLFCFITRGLWKMVWKRKCIQHILIFHHVTTCIKQINNINIYYYYYIYYYYFYYYYYLYYYYYNYYCYYYYCNYYYYYYKLPLLLLLYFNQKLF